MRGGEKVLEQLCTMFPQADIFTHAYRPDKVSPQIRAHRVITTSVGRLPFASRLYQKYLPLMPAALDELDLSAYDLVLSSEAGPAKGVITPVDVPHLCYRHSPMRYIWDQYQVYRDNAGFLTRQLMPSMARKLRAWDVQTAARPDRIIANSQHVAHRVQKYWRRDADVINPPVSVQHFKPVAPQDRGGYYLWLGELAPYKRPDLAIEAFNRLDRPLFVIGGPDKAEAALARKANPNIRFLGRVDDDRLRQYLACCRALIFPGEEDFGIVPVEAMASGRPVIAYGDGSCIPNPGPGGHAWCAKLPDGRLMDYQRHDPAATNITQELKALLAFLEWLRRSPPGSGFDAAGSCPTTVWVTDWLSFALAAPLLTVTAT